jgi:hypothetical protein
VNESKKGSSNSVKRVQITTGTFEIFAAIFNIEALRWLVKMAKLLSIKTTHS